MMQAATPQPLLQGQVTTVNEMQMYYAVYGEGSPLVFSMGLPKPGLSGTPISPRWPNISSSLCLIYGAMGVRPIRRTSSHTAKRRSISLRCWSSWKFISAKQ